MTQNHRIDLSEWLIHFVHDRDLKHYPKGVELPLPFCFDNKGTPLIHSLDEISHDDQVAYENSIGHPYGLAPDASAYTVLKRILFDGYIKSGWSFRKGKPTIYGPKSAVCFTEMPLYALIEYASNRNDSSLAEAYGIAIRKRDMFRAGSRPVIYGLSGTHTEASRGNPFFRKGLRCLSSSCGLALHEQYRYVAMNLDQNRRIDWTHEREWRWSGVGAESKFPGLPLWVENDQYIFGEILVIVKELWQSEDFVNSMKIHYDEQANIYDSTYSRKALENTVVVSLEEVKQNLSTLSNIRLEDLPTKDLSHITPNIPSAQIIQKVERAIYEAKKAAKEAAQRDRETAPRNKQGYITDVCGFASVVTYEANSEITDALIELDQAFPCDGDFYIIGAVTLGIDTEQALRVAEAAAKAAAKKLSELLGQHFSVHSSWD